VCRCVCVCVCVCAGVPHGMSAACTYVCVCMCTCLCVNVCVHVCANVWVLCGCIGMRVLCMRAHASSTFLHAPLSNQVKLTLQGMVAACERVGV